MIVVAVGFLEGVNVEGAAVVLSVSETEAMGMAAHLYKDVQMEKGDKRHCDHEDCKLAPAFCTDHYDQAITHEKYQAAEDLQRQSERHVEVARAGRLLLLSLAHERDSPDARLRDLTDARARDLADLVGAP